MMLNEISTKDISRKKQRISVRNIVLITCISIMILTALIMATVIAIFDHNFIASLQDHLGYYIIIGLIAMGVAIFVYFKITDKLMKPADDLIRITEKFARGDLSQKAQVVRNDEIGMLTKSFNKMADTIYSLVNELEEKVNQRTMELEKANEILRINRNQLRLILDSTCEGIYGMDIDGNCTFCNTSAIEILGYKDQGELIGKDMHQQIHHSRRNGTKMPIIECRIHKAILEGNIYHVDDEVFWRKDGTFFDVAYNAYPQFENGEIRGAVITFSDITEAKSVQEQIDFLNFHDPVTGIYNRSFFEKELRRVDRNKNLPISIIYGDVNGLKLLNDILGHEKGDELLKKTADVLTRVSREDDIVSRIGGDEFVILLTNTDARAAEKIIRRIKKELASKKIAGIKGSISLGTSTKTSPDQDINMVLKYSEAEMYKLKSLESKNINSAILKDIMEYLYERSPMLRLHSIDSSQISEKIALNMKLSEADIRRARDGGLYHDIGKIALNDKILNKIGKLKGVEKEEMEQHPLIGFRLLNLFNETLDLAEIILAHHENWDGSGYPKGLKGEEIPLISRIISVAEGYEGMTNELNIHKISREEALEQIKSQSGVKYDPRIVESFLNIIERKA